VLILQFELNLEVFQPSSDVKQRILSQFMLEWASTVHASKHEIPTNYLAHNSRVHTLKVCNIQSGIQC